MPDPRRGLSLVEVLVVIGIIGVLVGLTLPAVNKSRGTAARVSCQNNLKQIGLALQHFHDTHGRLPPLPTRSPPARDPNALLGWMVLVLPQMEQGSVYRAAEEACRTDANPIHDPPHVGLAAVVKTYACPADGRLTSPLTDRYGVRAAFTSYIGIGGAIPPGSTRGHIGVLGSQPGCRLSGITDGQSQTIVVSERPPPASLQAGWWYPGTQGDSEGFRGPNNTITLGGVLLFVGDPCVTIKGTLGPGQLANPCDRFHLWSLHSGGANFLFADGSVRFLTYSAEPMIIALASRSGGEAVDLP